MEDRINPSGRPDFIEFIEALRDEARWVTTIHKGNKQDDGSNDARMLIELANHAERVGKELNYISLTWKPSA